MNDDGTLDKVRAGLREADPFLDDQVLTDMISGMQNQGILFRERTEKTGDASACDNCGEGLTPHGFHESTGKTRCAYPPVMLKGHPTQLTDGFHTMEELYEHRRALTAALAAAATSSPDYDYAWRSKAHHPDDSPMFDGGYFIVGIELPNGTITYHYKLSHWDDFAAVPELEHAPKWDGAAPAATVDRLLDFARASSQIGRRGNE